MESGGFTDVLDFGCGLGRHSIFFARNGFNVSAFDLSAEGVEILFWRSGEELSSAVNRRERLAPSLLTNEPISSIIKTYN